jgi:hypothetical protein
VILLERANEYELRALAADDQALAGDEKAAVAAASWMTIASVLRGSSRHWPRRKTPRESLLSSRTDAARAA